MRCGIWLLALVGAWACGAEEALVARNRALQKDVAELRTRVNGLADACVRMERTIEVLGVTRDLMSGRLRTPPKRVERTTRVAAFETEAPRVLTKTSDAKRAIEMRWLKTLQPGTKYRCTCEMKAQNVKGCEHIKFGGFVPVKGGPTQWPAAAVGAGTFDWRTIAFDYVLPSGGTFCLVYGLEAGTGTVWVRNVTVDEVAERYDTEPTNVK